MIVQADSLETGISQVIIAMISSNLGRVGHPSRILIETLSAPGKQSGLLFDSVVMCDNLATVSLKAISRTIGNLGDLEGVNEALRRTLDL